MKKSRSLRTIGELAQAQLIAAEDVLPLEKVAAAFNVTITPAITTLLKDSPQDSAIHKQFLPQIAELEHAPEELVDPIGDNQFEKVKGLVHRYPDRCLLKVANVCPIYCRFCFRKEMIGAGSDAMSSDDLAAAYEYIREHPDIWEVILTGGDPLILKPSHLKRILEQLVAIPHVEVLRIHSRLPIVSPEKVSQELLDALAIDKALYIVVHVNHPDELTSDVIKSCASITAKGIPLLSQSVLLKGVNADPDILKSLFRKLVANRIKPYYLHHPDLVRGTSHFRLNISEGQEIMRQLQGHLSGLCQPTYVVDIPGGGGKVPLGPCYAHQSEEGWRLENYLGEISNYNFSKSIRTQSS